MINEPVAPRPLAEEEAPVENVNQNNNASQPSGRDRLPRAWLLSIQVWSFRDIFPIVTYRRSKLGNVFRVV